MEERRSDKYDKSENTPEKNSRVTKNRCLYDEINNKIGYEEITYFESNTEIDLSALNIENPNRSDYQKIKEYKDILGTNLEEKKENVEREFKPKTFDINLVLEEAKKNREIDDLESKRNLKEEEYSVLHNLNKKYLNKKIVTKKDDLESLKDIIDEELEDVVEDDDEKDLLSDLLATTVDIKLESNLTEEELKELCNYKKEETETEEKTEDELENTFYTESMELSKDDLISAQNEDEDEDEFYTINPKGKKLKIAIILILLLTMIAVVAYFVIKHI